MKHEPFHHPRLSPQENKACEMYFNGMERAEILEELEISSSHLSQLYCKARNKGIDIPRGNVGKRGSRARVPIERLVHLRDQLEKRGFRNAGLYRIIAERVGMKQNCVTVRLWRYDKGLGPRPQWEGKAA
jgi:hypothetical protein